jgi:hypothetical protein
MYIKIEGGNPSIKKYKANESTSRHSSKKKQTINKNKIKKNPMRIGPMLRNDDQRSQRSPKEVLR